MDIQPGTPEGAHYPLVTADVLERWEIIPGGLVEIRQDGSIWWYDMQDEWQRIGDAELGKHPHLVIYWNPTPVGTELTVFIDGTIRAEHLVKAYQAGCLEKGDCYGYISGANKERTAGD